MCFNQRGDIFTLNGGSYIYIYIYIFVSTHSYMHIYVYVCKCVHINKYIVSHPIPFVLFQILLS